MGRKATRVEGQLELLAVPMILVLAGVVATLHAHPLPPPSCACDCVDADGEIDLETCERDGEGEIIPNSCDPLLDDLECCTDPQEDDPTFASNGGLPCGCIAVEGVAAIGGRFYFGGVEGCTHVHVPHPVDYPPGVPHPTDSTIGGGVGGWECNANAVAACRRGGCTRTVLDSSRCRSD